MNNIQKGLLAFMVGGLAAGAFVACDEDDTFDINSPSWLDSRIDSIANSKNNSNSDTTIIEVARTTIGETDNSSGWWADFSDIIAIPSGKRLVMEFDNYSSCANNYNNWVLATTNKKGTSDAVDGYKEYFVLRSDAFGWGGKMSSEEGYTYDAANITTNYAEVAAAAGAEDQWAYFREKMNGSHVVIEVQHVSAGYIYVTATMTATDGTVLKEEYHQTASAADDIYAFLTVDGSHYENFSAMLLPATIVITESNPASMVLSNTPTFLTLGDTVYHAGVTAKVTFEDGTSTDVTEAELTFIAPDLTTVGVKTVNVLYNKTSRGNYCSPIIGSYSIQVTDFKGIEIVVADGYVLYYKSDAEEINVDASRLAVYGVGSDGEKTELSISDVTISAVEKISETEGKFTVEYQGLKSEETIVMSPVAAITPISVSLAGTQVGADKTTAWWTVFSPDTQVKVGQCATFKFTCYSDNAANFHSPVVVLRTAEKAEYAVLRQDNYGWGTGYAAATLESNWNWDTFLSSIDGSSYEVSITNNGSSYDVVYNVVDANGDSHYQKYIGIAAAGTTQVDADDLYVTFTCEGAYLVFE